MVVKWHRWSQALNFAVFYLTKWYKHFEGQDSVSNYNQILSPDSDSDSIEKKISESRLGLELDRNYETESRLGLDSTENFWTRRTLLRIL